MSFLEHIGNSLTSIQPWREFPLGHPRHGEAPLRQKHAIGLNRTRVDLRERWCAIGSVRRQAAVLYAAFQGVTTTSLALVTLRVLTTVIVCLLALRCIECHRRRWVVNSVHMRGFGLA